MLIRFYQLFIRTSLGCHCRFEPSCSSYALDAIYYYGPIKGMGFGLSRILRCHPWGKAGYDPVLPPNHKRD